MFAISPSNVPPLLPREVGEGDAAATGQGAHDGHGGHEGHDDSRQPWRLPAVLLGVVVGSALVDQIASAASPQDAVKRVLGLCRQLAEGVQGARR